MGGNAAGGGANGGRSTGVDVCDFSSLDSSGVIGGGEPPMAPGVREYQWPGTSKLRESLKP